MKAHYQQHKAPLLFTIGAWLLMVLLLWSLPIAFCGYLATDMDTNFWYWLSQSGGVYGTTVLALLLCSAAAFQQSTWWRRIRAFAVAFGFLLITLGGIAALNEYVIKPLTHVPRPSHVFLLNPKGVQIVQLEQFYLQEVPARQAYLQQFLKQHPESSVNVSPLVLAHWVQECGYSFPSGHSQNAFLLGSMLTLWLGFQLPSRKQGWLLIPLSWSVLVCLSRVALGVHSERDVAIGAAFGLVMAYLFSLSGLLSRVFQVTAPTSSEPSAT